MKKNEKEKKKIVKYKASVNNNNNEFRNDIIIPYEIVNHSR